MNELRTLFLQDLARALTSKTLQHGSASQLHTASSCRRFWSFFEFSKTEESLTRMEKPSRDPRIPLPPAPREPAATSTDTTVAGNGRRLPSTAFGFDASPAVYRSTCKFRTPFAKRKVEETSLLDGNPVPRNLKLKLQGYKMLESELEAFEMARLGEERTTEDVFEIRGDSRARENSIQCGSAAKETKETKETKEVERDARETPCGEESVNLSQGSRFSGESDDSVLWRSQAPRPPSLPPPPCCPPPSQAPLRPPDPQCPSGEPRCPSQTPAETWSPPNAPPGEPTCPSSCPPPCPRPCAAAPCQPTEKCSFVPSPESARKITSALVGQGAGQYCGGPSSMSPPASRGTTSQPLENQMTSPVPSFPTEPLRSVESACRFTPATPAAPTSCSGGSRISRASATTPSLRLKEARTSLNSMSSGRSVSGLSSIGSVGILNNSSGQSALPRAARSLPGRPRESKKASAAYNAKSQSSCSDRSKRRSKSNAKRTKDSCKRKGCFDDANDSFCGSNKPGRAGRKRPRKRVARRTRKACSARVSKPPERRSECKEGARERSSCGAKALGSRRSAACPGGLTEETCSTKKPQCPAGKRSDSSKDTGSRRSQRSCRARGGPTCTKERDTCRRSEQRSCDSSKSSSTRPAKSERKRSRSPCSPRRATRPKETRRNDVCKGYVCPGNAGPETCTANKPECPRKKKKATSKKTRRSCSRRSDGPCPPNRSQCPGTRGSCDSRSFCTHVPRYLSLLLPRFYGRDAADGRDDVKCGEDTLAGKYSKPGPSCKKSGRRERDASCRKVTRTLSCEEAAKKSPGNSMRTKDDDVQSVRDQLAREREEVEVCKKGSGKGARGEARREEVGSRDGAAKAETGLERAISHCKLKKVGPCKDVESSRKKSKWTEKGKGQGERCSASASDLKRIVQRAPQQVLQTRKEIQWNLSERERERERVQRTRRSVSKELRGGYEGVTRGLSARMIDDRRFGT